MTLVLIIFGVVLVLATVGLVASIAIGEVSSKTNTVLADSGEFSVKIKLTQENFEKSKPSSTEVRNYLNENKADLGDQKINELVEHWENSVKKTIDVVVEGYENKIKTFRYVFDERDLKYCDFLRNGNYISIEQIYNHPELLPPFHIGCQVQLVGKEAGEFGGDESWKSIQPVEGEYIVPDWRQIAE